MYVAQHYTYTITQHNTQQARTYMYMYTSALEPHR